MEKITFKQLKSLLISQPYFVWNYMPVKETNEFDLENFWKQDIDYADTSAAKVIMSTFSKIVDKATEDLISNGAIVLTGDIDSKIDETKKYIGTDKIIINPVFEYNGAIAKPLAYDFKNNYVYEVKFSKKTKRMDFMKAYYQTEIINHSVQAEDYFFYIPKNTRGLKGEINLEVINRVSVGKGGHAYDDIDKNGDLKSVPIMKALKDSYDFPIKSIDLYIEDINAARNIDTIVKTLDKDVTDFGYNPSWDELLENIDNPWYGYNGNVISKASIAEGEIKESPVLDKLQEISKTIINDKDRVMKLINRIKNAFKIVWYDFEGFSLPFPALNNTKSYQQMVFQVSKIVTDGDMNELAKENLVWDPKELSLDDLYNIIVEVYADKADEYVVYNQGYENARLKEMAALLIDDPRYEEALNMVEHIKINTLDLMDMFKINSAKTLPMILLSDQKGKASIKNIEKHISDNNLNIGYSIKEYKNLDIKNGGMAMKVAIERATNVMGNNEWVQTVDKLKEYCENDVKAMIMVYYYVLYLLKE